MSRIRTIIFSAYLAILTLGIGALGVITLPFGARGARVITRNWARATLFGLNIICGLRHVVRGGPLPEGAAIIAANHQSMWETVVFFALARKPAMVFKRELLKVPVYGWYGALAGSIPIDRDAGPKAIRRLTAAAAKRFADGCQVIVFPEGTRAAPGETLPLQPGIAAIYKAAPVAVTPALHDSGRFWKFPGGLSSPKEPGVITLTILPPIEAGLDRKVFQARLESALAPRGSMGTRAQPDLARAPSNAAA